MTMTPSQREGAIAIIGMSGRFPGAQNVEEYWQNIRNGVESISTFSREELLAAGREPAVVDNPRFVPRAGILPGIDQFDAAFFGMNRREAEVTDPQQRLFLECAWQALEDAGYDAPKYEGAIGVFAGSVMSSYLFNVLANPELMATLGDFLIITSNDKDHLATRASYKLNLRGPSLSVQTACSTSLVAVGMACQSLLDQQCDMALAGGAAIRVPQNAGYLFQEGMIYSPDGSCRPFAEDAAGTLFSNGLGLVVLKRLDDAIADGDMVHAVIRGWAINNDGAQKVGYTAPSPHGQAEVIAMAQALADVPARSIGYVEAHGTATALGDPLEIAALTEAFRLQTSESGFCAIGSVKGNIGHLDAAAGVAGLIKAIQALRHREIPPSLHCERPNPAIDFATTPFFVNTRLVHWARKEFPRRAAVSAFGIGGTNAHVVLEEWDEVGECDDVPAKPVSAMPAEHPGSLQPSQLLVLSARSEEALDQASIQMGSYLLEHPDVALTDVAWTLQAGRHAFDHRRIAVARTLPEAAEVLQSFDPARVWSGRCSSAERPIVFLFPGQGSQYVNIGRGLYESQPVFRDALDECARHLTAHLGLDLRTVLYPAQTDVAAAAHQLAQTQITQPALCAVEIAMARLLMDWGLRPQAMIGHSVGEYVAAHLAGVFSLQDALALVAERGRLIQQQPQGAMLVVPLPAEQVSPLLGESLQLAAWNELGASVVSGPITGIDQFVAAMALRGLQCQRLETSHAFHSAMMDPVLPAFRQAVEKVHRTAPVIPYVTNLDADWATAEQVSNPDYWSAHLRQPVRFADSIATLLRKFPAPLGCSLLEVGPGRTLTTLARRHPERGPSQSPLATMRHALETQADTDALLTAVGRLWLAGAAVDWHRASQPRPGRRVSLPTYPFERERYWVDARRPDIFDVSRASSTASKPEAREGITESATDGVQPGATKSSGNEPLGEDAEVRFAVPSWQQAPPPSPAIVSAHPETSRYLIFEDDLGVGAAVAAQLGQFGCEVISVTRGARWEKHSPRQFIFNSRNPADYEALIRESGIRQQPATDHLPIEILHMLTLDAQPGTAESDLNRGFLSLTRLAQALGEQAAGTPVRITIVSSGVHAVTGGVDENLCPGKSAMLGALRAIPQEYPLLNCRSIDFAPSSKGEAHLQMCTQLLAEIITGDTESLVAYRGGRRWIQRWNTLTLPTPAAQLQGLREGGAYVITGGLGGLGLAFAKFLAKTARAKLVLVSRTVGNSTSTDALGQIQNDDRLRHLDEVEQLGGEVMLAIADVADAAQMEAVVTRARARFGAIAGVIHAAGVPGGGLIQMRSPDAIAGVFRPKIQGTLVLDRLFRGAKLDFFVLCSSLAALAGGVGQSDYAAANAFLDGFAQSSYGDGRNVISINWDLWQQVGMAVNTAVPQDMQAERTQQLGRGLLPAQGTDALMRVLGSGLSQVAVSKTAVLKTAFEAKPLFSATPLFAQQQVPQSAVSPVLRNSAKGTSNHADHANQGAPLPVAATDVVESKLAEIWTTLLGVKEVDPYDNFFELGGHSLLGNRLILLLRSELHVDLPLRSLFEVPTFAGMVERIRALR